MTHDASAPEHDETAQSTSDPDGPPPTPDWVKLLVLAALVGLAIVVGLALLGGVPHGPGMHAPR